MSCCVRVLYVPYTRVVRVGWDVCLVCCLICVQIDEMSRFQGKSGCNSSDKAGTYYRYNMCGMVLHFPVVIIFTLLPLDG